MSETNKREVNAPEIVHVDDDIEETPDDVEEEDETVIPPVDEEPPAKETPAATEDEDKGQDDEEAPADSSPEGAQPEATDPEAPSKQPAPVPGETPREKALRLEVQRLKGLRRKEQIQDMTGQGATAPRVSPEVAERMKKLRETYSEEEIANMEEAIDVLAQSKGYVKQEQTYQTAVNDVVDQFITDNPEYKPENDPEDVRWNRFQDILKSGIYNLAGKTPKELRTIFNKVHKDVVDELGEPTIKTNDRKVAAERQKIKSVSHSGGTKSPQSTTKKAIDPEVRKMFQGFDDDDLA